MAHCKNVGGGLGDDDDRRPPPSSSRDKGKGLAPVPTKKKRKRPDRETQRLIAIAEAPNRAERGGRSGSIWIEDPDPARVQIALQMTVAGPPHPRFGPPPVDTLAETKTK